MVRGRVVSEGDVADLGTTSEGGMTSGGPRAPKSEMARSCPACGGDGRDRRYRVEGRDLLRCELCRTEYLVESGAEVPATTYWDSYKFELYADAAVQSEYESRYEELVGRVEQRFGPFSSVLDVGCGIGNFVDWAARRWPHAVGVDVDADAVATARDRGLDVHRADSPSDAVPEGSVDLVTLWDVIEHVADPHEFLRQACASLRPGGLVLIETPDVRFPLRPLTIAIRKVIEPIRWSDMLYYAEHRMYFSARGLSTLMASCGLQIVDEIGMRSPSNKIASILEIWAEKGAGAGRLGPALFGPLDASMRAVGMTNKLIMVGRLAP